MNLRKLLTAPCRKAIYKVVTFADCSLLNSRNSDIVLTWALQKGASKKDIFFPSEYLELLRDCIEKKTFRVLEIKTASDAKDDSSSRCFSFLIDELRHVPPVEFSVAEEIALIADSYRGNVERIAGKQWEGKQWAGIVRSIFSISSSSGTKGRILSTIVLHSQSKRCLELGTSLGMSSLFILEALKRQGPEVHLSTLEGWEAPFRLSSTMLTNRYGHQVSCEFGSTQERLPQMVSSFKEGLDFMFHDAGHSKEDYIRDFHTVLPIMKPGAVILIDDIRWNDPRIMPTNPHCYAGWKEIVRHPRVRRAVEIDDDMGLLLLGD